MTDQIQEYRQEVASILEADHNGKCGEKLTVPADVNIPHYNSVNMLLSNIWALVDHIVEKNEEQQNKNTELTYNKMDAEQNLVHANSHVQSLEVELKTSEANLQ